MDTHDMIDTTRLTRTLEDRRIAHEIEVEIDVTAGDDEEAREKADVIAQAVSDALEEL